MTSLALQHLRASSFERLHLRRNPFGELSRSERAAAACVDTAEVAAFLQGGERSERRVLQLVAEHGRGKSTLLIALHARDFPHAPYTQLREKASVPAPDLDAPVHFVDSIENLSWLGRRKLYRQCERLACTTHRNFENELRRAGYRVLTRRVGITSFDELVTITDARIEAAALPTGRAPLPSRELLLRLHREFVDDLRSIEHALYLEYERLRSAASPDRASSR